jgi:predicted esterase
LTPPVEAAVRELAIATTTHGRYLVAPPSDGRPAPLLVGFHGYAEPAEAQLERMRRIPGADRWMVVAIQGLNRFYQRRTNEVIAGWMTRQDREHAIADNLAYVAAVVGAMSAEARPLVVFAGFSQGVAMAFRAASASAVRVAGVIAAGGDVPPELDAAALARVPAAVVCRGVRDDWYTAAIHARDVERLAAAGVGVTPVEFDGGHEWSSAVVDAAAKLLNDAIR